ncbi:hypothetical protein [Sutterella sp.]|uniref:hypothetical protein n=1 Tax=Sutterella sp. TaxID=1981025 RepID=UPI0026DFB43E|nr:hypothetical protein [Sutterella sp.]MDO5531699.1 hypothetical protein [Sutterella sp.]
MSTPHEPSLDLNKAIEEDVSRSETINDKITNAELGLAQNRLSQEEEHLNLHIFLRKARFAVFSVVFAVIFLGYGFLCYLIFEIFNNVDNLQSYMSTPILASLIVLTIVPSLFLLILLLAVTRHDKSVDISEIPKNAFDVFSKVKSSLN